MDMAEGFRTDDQREGAELVEDLERAAAGEKIEGRFDSYEDKASWMLSGRDRDRAELLPGAEHADLDADRLLESFAGKDGSAQGGDKWETWRDLGYDMSDPKARKEAAAELLEVLRKELPDSPCVAVKATEDGRRYDVPIEITGPNGRTATLETRWNIGNDAATPALVANTLDLHEEEDQ